MRYYFMRILFYKANNENFDLFTETLSTCAKNYQIHYNIHIFEDINMLFKNIFSVDILFFDLDNSNSKIDMIELGHKINIMNPQIHIFIISKSMHFLVDGYRINAEGFILKSTSKTQLNSLINIMFVKYIQLNTNFIDYRITNMRVFTKDIVYVDFYDNHSYLAFIDGSKLITPYCFSHWIHKLEHFNFFQSYKSILVNIIHIEEIDTNNILLSNQEKIPVSRHFKAILKKQWMSYLQDIH